MEIKEGGFYVNRKGEKRGPLVSRASGVKWYDGITKYNKDGSVFSDGKHEWDEIYTKHGGFFPDRVSDFDLIAEWTEPAAEPEWGEWMDYEEFARCYKDRVDYQLRYITGVPQYRVRKAPPAPVVRTFSAYVYVTGSIRADATVDLIDGKPDWTTLKAVTESDNIGGKDGDN